MANSTGSEVAADEKYAVFAYEVWSDRLPALACRYREAQPFPHIYLAGLVDEAVIRQAAREFPGPADSTWIQYKHYNENKLGKAERAAFPPLLGRVIDELNSTPFVTWLSQLTGIPDLLPDPSLEGGGLHQTERGGFLHVHTDFSHHHHRPDWRRRCNLILYLNEDWQEEWGGALELWDPDVQRCIARCPPLLNHAVIFETNGVSYHGYPDPICPPEGITRKSIALYYYTRDTDPAPARRATNYRARPGDGARALLIWLDKKVLALYSRVKSRFGLSDKFASKILGLLARKNK